MPVLIGDRLHHKRPHQNAVICNGRSCRNQLKCRYGKALSKSDGAGIDFGPPFIGGQGAACLTRTVDLGFLPESESTQHFIMKLGTHHLTDFNGADVA